MRGRVKWFSEAKGFGFVADDAGGPDCFVHHTAIENLGGDRAALRAGDEVEYTAEHGPRGLRASWVRLVEPAAS